MKKILTILMSSMLLLGLTACGSTGKTEPKAAAAPAVQNKSTQPAATSNKKGKVLVAYYSASGTTKKVADIIAGVTGGTSFELKPAEPYSNADLDYNNSSSRVSKEHNNNARVVKLTTTTVPNWADYDTVFIGYPIWWGIAAWPVNNFVKGNDFSGKTVIPFCTSTSSGLGQSGDLLADMAGTGDWQDGGRFSSGASSSKVESWVNGLDLK